MVFDQQRIHAEIEALTPRIIADRRHLHRHAETSLKEFGTSAFIAERLDALGIEHVGSARRACSAPSPAPTRARRSCCAPTSTPCRCATTAARRGPARPGPTTPAAMTAT